MIGPLKKQEKQEKQEKEGRIRKKGEGEGLDPKM